MGRDAGWCGEGRRDAGCCQGLRNEREDAEIEEEPEEDHHAVSVICGDGISKTHDKNSCHR